MGTTNRYNLDKKLVGLYGEMELAIRLHKEGWQVYRAYIDELIDFVISRYYCSKCECFTDLYIREKKYKKEKRKCRTNLCKLCQTDNVRIVTKFIQAKTSAGNKTGTFSFHPKLSHLIEDLFCVWIFIHNFKDQKPLKCDFFIFKGLEIAKIDNIKLPSYQITDNQKISLKLKEGEISTKGVWSALNQYKDFKILKNKYSNHKN